MTDGVLTEHWINYCKRQLATHQFVWPFFLFLLPSSGKITASRSRPSGVPFLSHYSETEQQKDIPTQGKG